MFEWVSAHSKLNRNEKAYQRAKNIAEKGGKKVESWYLLIYIKKNMSQICGKELTSLHERKTQEKKASCHGFYTL